MEKIINILKHSQFSLSLCRIAGIFLLVIGYFLTAQMTVASSEDVAAAGSGAGESKGGDDTAVAPTPALKKMGIEIETSAIKIDSPGGSKIGFTIFNPPENEWIVVEEDTSDATFRGVEGFESFNKNLECKTVGGLEKEELIEAAGYIQNILRELYTKAIDAPLRVPPEMLKAFMGDETLNVVAHNDRIFFVKSKPDDDVVRPQITYQLPFEEIVRVFEHLGSLNHTRGRGFLDALNPLTPPERLNRSATHPTLRQDEVEQYRVKDLFKTKISHVFAGIKNQKLKGFCCLFFYYWYELFNNNQFVSSVQEPGLKQFLGIMSRISFSQLYDYSLDESEKKELRGILDDIVGSHGAGFRLKSYKGYDRGGNPALISTEMTLLQWYQSITDHSSRRHGVDLLSPPPTMPERDSMGALRLEQSNGFPLIEVRGYANLKPVLRINRTREFVQEEANWFFDEYEEGE